MKNKIKILIFTILAIIYSNLKGQSVVVILQNLPQNTPLQDSFYFASNLNNWQPNAPTFQFQPRPDGKFQLAFTAKDFPIEFKITRGNWAKVETAPDGGQLPNRIIQKISKDTLRLDIANWNDLVNSTPRSTRSANVQILDSAFYSPQLDRHRRIWVYLPVGYDASPQRRYPVLYMHDGQNVFDAATSYSGEWAVDETLNARKAGLIVVAIDNGGDERMNEYSPYDLKRFGKGKGEAYGRFIVETLKPFIDNTFRTFPDKDHTGIMGSSMGGLISMYVGATYPQVFGRLGVFSPSFWVSDKIYDLAKTAGKVEGTKIYLNVGGDEHPSMGKGFRKMQKILRKVGYDDASLNAKIVEGGQHHESFWREEFNKACEWLFEGVF